MTSESTSPIAALPVRRRGTLEIFDTALKLYRRYFWVLIFWSALVSVSSFVPLLALLSLLTSPLLYGAVSCCVAAAVRGQNVNFAQTWRFSKPRYGAMLGTMILTWIIFFCVIIGLYIVSALVAFVGILALSSAPEAIQIVMGIIGFIAFLVLFSVLGVVAFGWLSMVPIVICLEDDKRGTASMGRALELLNGHWRRVFGMSLILGLAMLAVFGIVGGAIGFLGAARGSGIFTNGEPNSAFWGLISSFGAFTGFFFLLWNPAQSLIISVLYLDLRVRREALDLEWTAYSSAPAPTGAVQIEVPSTPGIQENHPYAAMPTPEVMPASFAAGGFAGEALTVGEQVEGLPIAAAPQQSAENFIPPTTEQICTPLTASEIPVAQILSSQSGVESSLPNPVAPEPVAPEPVSFQAPPPQPTVKPTNPETPLASSSFAPSSFAPSSFAPTSAPTVEPPSEPANTVEEVVKPFEFQPFQNSQETPPPPAGDGPSQRSDI